MLLSKRFTVGVIGERLLAAPLLWHAGRGLAAARAAERWIASLIISGVAEVGFFLTVRRVVVVGAVDQDCRPTMSCWSCCVCAQAVALATEAAARAIESFKMRVIVRLHPLLTRDQVRGSPSGRISGVVKVTPSGEGFGVGVTAVCGEPATPVSSWMRISIAKSSCTVLWQWFT